MNVGAHVPSSTPYSWPYDAVIDSSVTAVLVCGGGSKVAAATPRNEVAMHNIDALRVAFTAVGALIIVIDHEPIFSTIATADHPSPDIQRAPGDVVVPAAGIDGFYGGPLDAVLQLHGRTHLVLCGYGLETAIHSTVRRANDRGYECLTVIDASAAHDTSLVPFARSMIEMSGGIFGAVAETDDTIRAFTVMPTIEFTPVSTPAARPLGTP